MTLLTSSSLMLRHRRKSFKQQSVSFHCCLVWQTVICCIPCVTLSGLS